MGAKIYAKLVLCMHAKIAKMSDFGNRNIFAHKFASWANVTFHPVSCETSNVIAGMFDILEMMYVFFTSSTKRDMVFRQEVKDKDTEGLFNREIFLPLSGLPAQSQLRQCGRVYVL